MLCNFVTFWAWDLGPGQEMELAKKKLDTSKRTLCTVILNHTLANLLLCR